MSRPIIHHRSSDFRGIFERCLERLAQVYRTDGDVLVYTASGTGGMESAVSNLTRPGDRVVVVSAGHFGERWVAMTRNFGCEVEELGYEWGETPLPEDLAQRLRELGGAKVVFTTHSETSTGVVADVQGLAAAAKEAGALIAVDAVSSLGAVPLETDAWGLDSVISGSQKALMTPPGLATVVRLRRRVGCASRRTARPRYYFDWNRTRERAGGVRSVLYPGCLDRRRARGRARPAPGGGPRTGLRAPCPSRPCLPRRSQGDGPRAVLAGRRPLGGRHRDQRARRHRLRRARPDAPRPPRHRARAGPGPAQGQGLPHRPHRLLRRVRHHHGARRCRARAGGAGRRHRARRRP